MAKSSFIALINPTIALAIAAALFILWNYRRDNRYVAVLGMGYALLALSFSVQYVAGATGIQFLKLVSNILLPISAGLIIKGTLGRFGQSLPVGPLATLSVVSMAMFAWFLYGEQNITARVYIMNFLAGGLLLILGCKLVEVPGKRLLDRVLTVVVIAWAIQLFVRTAVVVSLEGPYVEGPEFYTTLYWITLTLAVACFVLVFSILVIAAIALDIADGLKAQSFLDPLCGLLNRRGYDDLIATEIARAETNALPLSIVLGDLDSFKYVNDMYGHTTGDQAIKAFAERACTLLPDRELAARIGGEEFVIVLPATQAAAARLFAESLRTGYSAVSLEGLPAHLRLTASFGVAERHPGEDAAGMLRRADAALYRAKREGRDRVVIATALHDASSAIHALSDRQAPLPREA